MNIIVCVKQVPSSNNVNMDPVTNTIIRDGSQSVLNPFDMYAIELAVQLKEKLGGQARALSMGIPATERLLKDAIARGLDGAVLLTDRAFAGADTLATSYTLSKGVEAMGDFNMILCGKMAVDGDTAQVGPELAQHLDIPHVTDVSAFEEVTEDHVVCIKQTDAGTQRLRVPLPAVFTVLKDIVMPRFPSIAGVRRSMETPVRVCSAQEIGADEDKIGLKGSPTQVVRSFVPDLSKSTRTLEGTTAEKVQQILQIWEEVK